MKKDGFIKTSDHGKIYFTEVGTGQPIVFVHGWSSNGEHSFSHMAEALKDSARCIYFDLRGHGRSYTYNASSISRPARSDYRIGSARCDSGRALPGRPADL